MTDDAATWGNTAAGWQRRATYLAGLVTDIKHDIARSQAFLHQVEAEEYWLMMHRGEDNWLAEWQAKYGEGYKTS